MTSIGSHYLITRLEHATSVICVVNFVYIYAVEDV